MSAAEGTAQPFAEQTCVLPDGRSVVAVQPAEAKALWREIEGDSPYRRACTGLQPGEAILDVGAHIGLASLCFAETAPGCPIYALEPAPATFACLQANLARHAPHATTVRKAVGRARATATLTFRPYMSSMSTLYADLEDDTRNLDVFLTNNGTREEAKTLTWKALAVEHAVQVEVTTVSAVMDEYGLESVGLLKIDVERAELDVLDGVEAAHWSRVRRLLLEVHDLDGRLGKVIARLAGRGYAVTVIQAPLFRGASVYGLLATRD